MIGEWSAWMPELRVLATAATIALLLYLVAYALIRLLTRLARPFLFAREMVKHTSAPLQFLIPLIGLQTVWSNADSNLFAMGGIRHVTAMIIIGVVTWVGLRLVSAVQAIILQHNPIDVRDNLAARRIQTQTRVLIQTLTVFVLIFGAAAMLMTFPGARQFGTSLLASAGLAGLAVGFAAKPMLGNLIAGLQIAITQPIRLDDVVIVENEWGRIEEITGTYVVVRIWDERRLIVPLQWFIENPFQNWTRRTSNILGSIFFWVDYTVPLEPLRKHLDSILQQSGKLWDQRVSVLQVTDATDRAIQIRILASSIDSSSSWDLRCFIREKMITFISDNYPGALPQMRAELHRNAGDISTNDRNSSPERQPPV